MAEEGRQGIESEQQRSRRAARSTPTAADGAPLQPTHLRLAQLQRTAGNQAVNALLRAYQVQTQRSAAPEANDGAAPEVGFAGGPVHEETSTAINARRGGGAPLDEGLRRRMEGTLAADLSDVRVHADETAHDLNRRVSAHAFTTGSDVFLGAGASAADARLMAHELTHVVQQRAIDAGGPLTVGAADSSHEQEAEAVARGALVGAAPPIQRRAAAPTVRRTNHSTLIQRYQSGNAGHGGIEEQALTDVGFSKDDAAAVYFGNWLRDFSQVPHEKLGLKLLPVLNILAQGEFGRTITQDDLGAYVPSEHLDNPLGGGSVEDDDLKAKDPAAWKKAYDDLSPAQKAAYDEEEKHRAEITAATKLSGLPEYIERGKMHSKQTLEASIKETDPVKQKLLLGNALHAVEDYFSHSNFVEACIMILKRDGLGGAKLTALAKMLAETTLGPAAVPIDKAGHMQIQTGTYKPGANETVSQIEILHTEIMNGELTMAFIKGLLKQKGLGLGDITRSYAKHKGGAIGGTIGGWVDDVSTFFTGSGVGAAAEGKAIGQAVGDDLGKEVDALLDSAAKAGLLAVAAFLRGIELGIDLSPLNELVDAAVDAKVHDLTKQAQAEAPVDPTTGKKPPTHTELAKDAPDNALFGVSASLAKEVDRQFGVAIQAAWAKGPTADPTPVTDLVDTYVSHPEHNGWWKTPLLAAVH